MNDQDTPMTGPRRGYTTFECEGVVFDWQNCEITGCPNCICVGMSDSLCYPHGIEFGAFTEAQFDADRAKRHPVTER